MSYRQQHVIQNRSEGIAKDLIKNYYDHNLGNIVFIAVFVVLTAIYLGPRSSKPEMVYGWAASLTSMLLIFSGGNLWYYKKHAQDRPAAFWERNAIFISIVTALITGALPWLAFDGLEPREIIIFSMLFAGSPAVSINYMACSPRLWLANNVALMAPIIAYTALRWDFDPALGRGFAFWMCLYSGYMWMLMRSSYKEQRQVLVLQQQLEQQRDSAEQANQSKTRFLATASHDIRQPIDALALMITVLKERVESSNNINDSIGGIFEKIERNIKAQKSIYDMLLEVSRLDTESLDLKFEKISLPDLMAGMQAEFSERARFKDLQFQVDCEKLEIFSDRRLLESVLRNLISNALKYTNSGGIAISAAGARRDGEALVEIWVSDTGVGISQQDQEAIFKEFFRVSSGTKDEVSGLGLGLSIVQRISKLLNISVDVISEPGCGSTFLLTLPQVPGDVLC